MRRESLSCHPKQMSGGGKDLGSPSKELFVGLNWRCSSSRDGDKTLGLGDFGGREPVFQCI